MKNKLLVSVILATYNWRKEWIFKIIDYVLNQSYPNIELLIINNALTNNVEVLILKYKNKNKQIIYLKKVKNLEESCSRNRWIFESSWKYIAFMDDDIGCDKGKINKQVEFLELNKNYVLCWTCWMAIDRNWKEFPELNMMCWDKEIRNEILQSNQFLLASVLLRKDILLFPCWFKTEFNKTEDYNLWLSVWQYWKLYNLKDKSIYYRTWFGNITTISCVHMKKLVLKSIFINRRWYLWFFLRL